MGSVSRGGSFFEDGGYCDVGQAGDGDEAFSEDVLVEVEWVDVEGYVYPGCVVFSFRCKSNSIVRLAPVTTPGRDCPGKIESPTRKRLSNEVAGPRTLNNEVWG